MEFAGYDDWKTTDDADNELGRSNGRPVPYRCLDCAWKGKGMDARSAHWDRTQHVILFADDPRFSDPNHPWWSLPRRHPVDPWLVRTGVRA